MNRKRLFALLLLCLAGPGAHAAPPETYPSKPVTLVVPFPVGGSADAVARAISLPLGKNLGQPLVVENVGGSSGSIGAAKVARSKPDGYTLLLGTVNEVVLAPLVNRAVTYKTGDFIPVGKVGQSTFILVGRQGIAARNIDELIEYARKKPGGLSYATSGIGSLQNVIMEDIQETSGTSMLHVPYRGGSSLVTDLLGGQVDLALVAPATFPEYLASGRLQVFGSTGRQRDELLKNVPTLNESKYLKGINQVSWVGLFAPANTPPAVTKRLAAGMQALLSDPDVLAHLRRSNISPGTVAEQPGFTGAVSADLVQMRDIVSKRKLNQSEVAQ